jgi:hypothetical protein
LTQSEIGLYSIFVLSPRNGYGGLKLGLKNIDSDQASDIVWQLKSPALEIKRARPAPNETVT